LGGASYLGGDFERCLDIPPYMFGEDQLRSEQRDTYFCNCFVGKTAPTPKAIYTSNDIQPQQQQVHDIFVHQNYLVFLSLRNQIPSYEVWHFWGLFGKSLGRMESFG